VVLGLIFGPAIAGGTLPVVFATLALALLVLGFVYGPLGGWMPKLFPVTVCYTGISIAFAAGGVIGGGLVPIGAQQLSNVGSAPLVGLFLSAAGLVTLAGIILGRPVSATE
jgi:predicted tellurium resistance membrane protein TerC